MDVLRLCNKIIKYSFYLLFILVPLILTPWNYELFEFNKMIVTYALTVIILTAWIVKMAVEKKFLVRKTIIDIPLGLFVVSQLVSSVFSMDPHVSWFGYYSRFNGGMLSVFSFVALYYAFVSNFSVFKNQEKSEKNVHFITTLLYATLGAGVLVSIYGILERLGIDKHIWVQDVQNRVFSTLGQPNWLAAYLVAILPIALHFAIRPYQKLSGKFSFSMQSLVFGGMYLLFFITLLFTKSRSGIAGFLTAMAIYFIGNLIFIKAKKQFAIPFLVINAVIIGILFFNGTNIEAIDKYVSFNAIKTQFQSAPSPGTQTSSENAPEEKTGTLLEYGGTESGTIRKFVWQAAITAWRASAKTFLIGTGTETFAFAFFQHKPIGHNLTSEWDFLYNKAHNEYLNYLTTTGIFGFGSYLLIIGLFTIWLTNHILSSKRLSAVSKDSHHLNATKDKHALAIWQDPTPTLPLIFALAAGWASVLVTNFFGFSVVIIQIFFFLFPAFIFVLLSKEHPGESWGFSLPKKGTKVIASVAMFVGILAIGYISIMWIGDFFFSTGFRNSRAGKLVDAYTNLTQATFFRPKEPLYYDELSVVLGSLSVASLEAGNATAASQLAKQSLAASDVSLTISPNNVNFWKSRTKIYFGFSSLDTKFVEAAKAALEKASALSPNDPKITYNLAVLEGRLGNNEKAIDILKKTINLKPNYRDAYFALNIFYQETKQPELAKAILEEYLVKVDPNDKEFQEKVSTQ